MTLCLSDYLSLAAEIREAMRATTLVAVFVAQLSFVAAQGPHCDRRCKSIPQITSENNPCGPALANPNSALYAPLSPGSGSTFFLHKTNTKIEIDNANVVHLWCHNSACWNKDYCRLHVKIYAANGAVEELDYVLPGYNDCCSLPPGNVWGAYMSPQYN